MAKVRNAVLFLLVSLCFADDYYYKLGQSLVQDGYNFEEDSVENKDANSKKEVAVEGFVYCQFGSEKKPLQGAVVGAGCFTGDAFVEAVTRSDGYFYIPLNYSSKEEIVDPESYRIFLVSSKDQTCNQKTNAGQGRSGASLINRKSFPNLILYKVGPFVFSPRYE